MVHNVFLKEFFEKVDFEKKSVDDKTAWNITQYAKIQIRKAGMIATAHNKRLNEPIPFTWVVGLMVSEKIVKNIMSLWE